VFIPNKISDVVVALQDMDTMHARYLRFRAVRPFADFAKPAGSAEAAVAASKRCWQFFPTSREVKQIASTEVTVDIEASGHAMECESIRSGVFGAVCFASSKDCDPDIHQEVGKEMGLDCGHVSPNLELCVTSQQEERLWSSRTTTAVGVISDNSSQFKSHWLGERGAQSLQRPHTSLCGGSSGFVRLMRLTT
jgi:hypothetical protein